MTSELATAGTAYDGRLTGDAFFTNVSYRGAFDPALPMSQQWTAGWTNFDPQSTNYDIISGVRALSAEVPTQFRLEQNYPNPFNPSTVIRYDVPVSGKVLLRVFNILGQEVRTLVNGFQESGRYEVTFDGSNLPTGTYLYRFESGNHKVARKMSFIK
jgi:hypothetical protein